MSDLIQWLADQLGYVPREEMEAQMAADDEMIERLRVASDKAATLLRDVQGRLVTSEQENADLRGAAAADEATDAEKMRPVVEFLEGLGSDPSDPVPAVDPVPSDPTPVPGAPEPDATAGTGSGSPDVADPGTSPDVPTDGGTVEQPGATTDAPLDPGTGEVQGGAPRSDR